MQSTGQLHLHPVSETHQLRPTLTYLDVDSRKKRRGGDDSDSDDGPPLDPDEPPPAPAPKKDKKSTGDVREIQVAARRAGGDDKPMQGGLSQARREMLMILRAEEEETWQDLDVFDKQVGSLSFRCRHGCLNLCADSRIVRTRQIRVVQVRKRAGMPIFHQCVRRHSGRVDILHINYECGHMELANVATCMTPTSCVLFRGAPMTSSSFSLPLTSSPPPRSTAKPFVCLSGLHALLLIF